MQDPNQKPLDLSPTEDGSIPAFLRRDVTVTSEKEVLPMKTDEDTDDSELPETEAPAPAKPPKPKKPKPVKPAVKAKGNGKGNGATPHKASAKAAPKAAVKAKGKAPVKAKARAKPVRDPAKLDAYGFRKGTIKSKAAAMYAKGKGATLAEIKEALGSVQFNLLTELEGNGFTIGKTEAKNDAGRPVTRYKINAK